MKKNISNFLLLFLVISLSCSDYKELRFEYKAEKNFFKSNKLMSDIAINPRVASKQDYEIAVGSFKDIIATYSKDTTSSDRIKTIVERSWLSVANIYIMKNDFTSANKIYDEIINSPNNAISFRASAQYLKAAMFEKQKKFDLALDEYEKFFNEFQGLLKNSKETNPNYLEVPLKIARLQTRLNRPDARKSYLSAREFYLDMKIEESNPLASTIYHLLALTYADNKDWEQTISILTNLISDYPDSVREPFILYEIANITANQINKKDDAIQIYEKIIQKYPKHYLKANILIDIGNLHLSSGQFLLAREYYKKAVDQFSDNVVLAARAQFGIGITYEKTGEWDRAINELNWVWSNYQLSQEALIVPNYIASYYQRNRMQKLADKSFEEAVLRFQSFYERYSKNSLAPLALFQLAVAYENLKKWDQAIETFKRLLANHPETNLLPQVYIHIGSCYEIGLKEKEQALQFYQTFCDKFPDHPAFEQAKQKISQLIGF